jgi:hypothetical protein
LSYRLAQITNDANYYLGEYIVLLDVKIIRLQEMQKCDSFRPVTLADMTCSVTFSLQANYTDGSTATCRRILVSTFVDRGVSRGQRGGSPTVVNLSSLHWSRYYSFKVAPHLSSQGLSGSRSRPTATRKTWQRWESNPGFLVLQPGTLTTRP